MEMPETQGSRMRQAVERFWFVQKVSCWVDPKGWKRKAAWAERRLRKDPEWAAQRDEYERWWLEEATAVGRRDTDFLTG